MILCIFPFLLLLLSLNYCHVKPDNKEKYLNQRDDKNHLPNIERDRRERKRLASRDKNKGEVDIPKTQQITNILSASPLKNTTFLSHDDKTLDSSSKKEDNVNLKRKLFASFPNQNRKENESLEETRFGNQADDDFTRILSQSKEPSLGDDDDFTRILSQSKEPSLGDDDDFTRILSQSKEPSLDDDDFTRILSQSKEPSLDDDDFTRILSQSKEPSLGINDTSSTQILSQSKESSLGDDDDDFTQIISQSKHLDLNNESDNAETQPATIIIKEQIKPGKKVNNMSSIPFNMLNGESRINRGNNDISTQSTSSSSLSNTSADRSLSFLNLYTSFKLQSDDLILGPYISREISNKRLCFIVKSKTVIMCELVEDEDVTMEKWQELSKFNNSPYNHHIPKKQLFNNQQEADSLLLCWDRILVASLYTIKNDEEMKNSIDPKCLFKSLLLLFCNFHASNISMPLISMKNIYLTIDERFIFLELNGKEIEMDSLHSNNHTHNNYSRQIQSQFKDLMNVFFKDFYNDELEDNVDELRALMDSILEYFDKKDKANNKELGYESLFEKEFIKDLFSAKDTRIIPQLILGKFIKKQNSIDGCFMIQKIEPDLNDFKFLGIINEFSNEHYCVNTRGDGLPFSCRVTTLKAEYDMALKNINNKDFRKLIHSFQTFDEAGSIVHVLVYELSFQKRLVDLKDDYVLTESADFFLFIFYSMIDLIASLHKSNLVHGDITPHSFIIDDNSGRILINDFKNLFSINPEGEENSINAARRSRPTIGFTQPGYTNQDKCSDVYALGVTFYYMIMGRLPFSIFSPNNYEKVQDPIFMNQLDPRIIQLINGMLVRDPKKRFGCSNLNGIDSNLPFLLSSFIFKETREKISSSSPSSSPSPPLSLQVVLPSIDEKLDFIKPYLESDPTNFPKSIPNHDETYKINGNGNSKDELSRMTLIDFDIQQRLGEGSSGKVNICINLNLDSYFACKYQKDKESFTTSNDKQTTTEIQIWKKLSLKFPNHFTKLFMVEFDKGKQYMVTELCLFGDLSQIQRRSIFYDDNKTIMAAQLITILTQLRDLNIVHADFKPGNILIKNNGMLALADFGTSIDISKYGYADADSGTAAYMAPEAIYASPLNSKLYGTCADIFSVGVVLYEFATNTRLFSCPYDPANKKGYNDCVKQKVLNNPINFEILNHHDHNNNNSALKNLLMKLLDKNPKTRLGCLSNGIDSLPSVIFFHQFFNPSHPHENNITANDLVDDGSNLGRELFNRSIRIGQQYDKPLLSLFELDMLLREKYKKLKETLLTSSVKRLNKNISAGREFRKKKLVL